MDQKLDEQGRVMNPLGPAESDILPKAEERRAPVFNPTGRVEHLMADETKVADVRRHPFGLFVLYVQVLVGLGVAFLIIFGLMSSVLDVAKINNNQGFGIATVFGLFVLLLATGFLFLASKIYHGNQIIVTDSNVTQILQKGLFNRKVSELSMHNVEDVTAIQKGVLQTAFNYGTLVIETAGEQNNFTFVYCPNPNAYAKAILDSRQQFIAYHSGSVVS